MRIDTATEPTTLVTALGPQSLLRSFVLAVLGAALLTLSAKIKVPFYPVPMTLQTLALAVLAAAFGARLAVASVLLYLAEGLAGLPVFTNTPPAAAGFAYMVGPTGGYLVGFIAAAFLIGHLAERGWDRSLPLLFGAMLLGDVLILGLGAGWLAFGAPGLGLDKALQAGVAPFLLGAIVKEALGASVVVASWSLVRKLRAR
jgi:biotin transport system substrate-specific component